MTLDCSLPAEKGVVLIRLVFNGIGAFPNLRGRCKNGRRLGVYRWHLNRGMGVEAIEFIWTAW